MYLFPEETIGTNYIYEAYMQMSDYILEMQEMLNEEYDVLTEADGDPKIKAKSLVSKKSLLGRLMDFIKKVIETFKGSANKFYKLYNVWLKNAKQNLDNVNFNNLSITSYNSYFESEDKLNDAKQMIFRVDAYNYKKLRSESMDEFIQKQPMNKYVDKEGSLANGCKNYFRYGEVNPRLTKRTISGDNLKTITSNCIEYCLNFNDTVTKISQLSKSFEDNMKIAENVINKTQGTTESVYYSYLEESVVDFSKLSLYDNISIDTRTVMMEAEEQQNSNNNTNNSAQDTSPNVETGPEKRTADGGKSGVETGDDSNEKQIRDLSNQDAKTLTFLCRYLQVVYGAVLTVAEERYNSYIKICRYALSKTKFKYDANAEKGDIIDKSKVDQNTQRENKSATGKIIDSVKNKIGKKE